jgi:regulator of sigma E protease
MALLAPILVLGLVILVHEAGHFWAAKIFGVYAPRFAIGFGPALWRKRWGETEYVIGALPLGGYVRMATRDDDATVALEGELDESKGKTKAPLDPDMMIPFGSKPVPADRWFESKPLWQRAIILLAGVTMNIVLAVVVAIGIFAAYGRPYLRPVVESVVPGKPAANAGMLAGDSITAVNGRGTPTWSDVFEAVSASPGREVAITVVRQGRELALRMTPEEVTDTDVVSGLPRQAGRVGMQRVAAPGRERVSLIAAVPLGTAAAWRLGTSVVDVLKGLVTGHISVTQLGGPIAIARTSVAEAKRGWESLLTLIAFLSVNLAVLNLVPIPLLDGGQLLVQTAETVKGSAFTDRTREWIARVGLAAIAALFLVVTFNDLKALVGSWLG